MLEFEGDADDAIAVLGLACRFPGAQCPTQFLSNLIEKFDPINRNSSSDDVIYGRIADTTSFDASFFNISHREAIQIDPQVRILGTWCYD